MIKSLMNAHMTKYRRLYVKVSRIEVIRRLCKKEYGAKRPTAQQQLEVIKKYDLNLYTSDGKRRSKEVIGKAIAKVITSL
jgi:hypothetical protein